MKIFEEGIAKLTNAQLSKLESAAKDKTGTTLRLTKKSFNMKNYHINYS